MATREHFHKLALRVSEYESVESAMRFKKLIRWVWLDCFSGKPAAVSTVKRLGKHFQVCLVSPELQHYPLSRIRTFQKLMPYVNAICTKQPQLWI